MYADSHRSDMHLWARCLPRGMFDGQQSVMPSPDHLTFHGLTKRLISGVFDLLSKKQRRRVGLSLRDTIARSHLPSTTIYNEKSDAIVSVSISEWAATLTVAAFSIQRVINSAKVCTDANPTPLQAALQVLDAYTTLSNALYFYPRAEIDGETAFHSLLTPADVRELGNNFSRLACAACLRGDTAAFGRSIDVPKLHRLRELLEVVIPALTHVRHVQELLFESAHQPLKRAIATGNGRDDAWRALERVLQGELASRIALQPSFFKIKAEWLNHAGIRAHLRLAKPLWSQPTAHWRCSGGTLLSSYVPEEVRALVRDRWDSTFVPRWRGRDTRGDMGRLKLGDCVGVLVLSTPGHATVNVVNGSGAKCGVTAYYRAVAFLDDIGGSPAAVVHPLVLIDGSPDMCVDLARFLYLPLFDGVRRALLLHSCRCECMLTPSGTGHSSTNRCRVFGRPNGYASRSG